MGGVDSLPTAPYGESVNDHERERYARQLSIDGFGEQAQDKLAQARVFIAGAGGLGCAVSLYLAAAGVGRIRIADHGEVELGNLNRQVLYTGADVGTRKVGAIAARLKGVNPNVAIDPLYVTLSDDNLPSLVQESDLLIDALDNLPTRLSLNKAALLRGVPLVHGAIRGFSGQLMTVIPGKTACLMCLYRDKAAAGTTPVIGVAPGVVGLLEATEAIKLLAGLGRRAAGTLLLFDGLEMSFTELPIERDPRCPHCGQSR
jgi:molybdopterin/thiamine biosynthesis adenylyltransferase